MTSKRSDLAVVVHNGKVYAIGGFTGEVSLVLFYFFWSIFFSIHSYLGPNQLIVEDINIEFHDILLSDPKAS